MIIGITGLKFSGKTTATDKLAKMLSYDVRSFATKLKEMICLFTGCSMEDLDSYSFKENEIVPEYLWPYCSNDKHTYRSLLQGFGDMMRDKNPNIFIDSVLYDNPTNLIISDCRFLNEAKAIKDRGGIIVRVVRDNVEQDYHKSETEIKEIEPDYIVYNNRSLKHLHDSLAQLVEMWKAFNLQ